MYSATSSAKDINSSRTSSRNNNSDDADDECAKMSLFERFYGPWNEQVLHNLDANGLRHRTKTSSGLWLGSLVGLSALLTYLKEDKSYSEICLVTGITGFSLFISSLCLFFQLRKEKVVAKDYHLLYFLPAIISAISFLHIGTKGLFTSAFWGIFIASMGTWGVVQLMSYLPGCFTLGEATAVMHGIILFLMSTFQNLPLRYHLRPIHSNDIVTVILQVLTLSVIAICILCAKYPIFRKTQSFYFLTFAMMVFITRPALNELLDQNPVYWVISFVLSSKSKILLVTYWTACLLFAFISINCQILKGDKATTSIRKIFHILAVMVYVPGLILEPTLLYLASGVILSLFLMIELFRIYKIPPIGHFLQQGFTSFADEKDSIVSLTPLYLLCGLSWPLWLPADNMHILILMSGVMTIGIGDSAASFVGSRWGKHRYINSSKSFEGTYACAISQYIFIVALALCGYVNTGPLLVRIICSTILVSILEAYTEQVDNLALPFVNYLCLSM
ncbi:dolichol kinase isoform X1 [Trichogramma pretiosum]|uniref:dolichol kinase isoform X1 n=2 Tax=Trichogramma pretiosum TaxID=7493 RepID=UPI0006C9D4C5|nr:dolichol kinase isoform X1 [Trichogramma pretiosum]